MSYIMYLPVTRICSSTEKVACGSVPMQRPKLIRKGLVDTQGIFLHVLFSKATSHRHCCFLVMPRVLSITDFRSEETMILLLFISPVSPSSYSYYEKKQKYSLWLFLGRRTRKTKEQGSPYLSLSLPSRLI